MPDTNSKPNDVLSSGLHTREKWATFVLVVGLGAFFYFGAEVLARHTDWGEFKTPAGIGEIFGLFASVIASVAGALGIDIFGILRKMRAGE